MTRFNKSQYIALTESFARALQEVQKSESEILNATVLKVAGIIADDLKHDNPNFNQRQFIEGIKATAKLAQ